MEISPHFQMELRVQSGFWEAVALRVLITKRVSVFRVVLPFNDGEVARIST
jgi:hypothetical protein